MLSELDSLLLWVVVVCLKTCHTAVTAISRQNSCNLRMLTLRELICQSHGLICHLLRLKLSSVGPGLTNITTPVSQSSFNGHQQEEKWQTKCNYSKKSVVWKMTFLPYTSVNMKSTVCSLLDLRMSRSGKMLSQSQHKLNSRQKSIFCAFCKRQKWGGQRKKS